MTKTLGLLSLVTASAIGAATPAAGVARSSIADLVDVTNSVCYPLAARELVFTAAPKKDRQILAAKNVKAGISRDGHSRIGRAGGSFLSGAITGYRKSGADVIVLGG